MKTCANCANTLTFPGTCSMHKPGTVIEDGFNCENWTPVTISVGMPNQQIYVENNSDKLQCTDGLAIDVLDTDKLDTDAPHEIRTKANPYSGTCFTFNGHEWKMCARDNGVEIWCDDKLKCHLTADE